MSTARHAIARRLGSRFTTRAAILAVIVGGLLLAAVPVFGRFLTMRSQETALQRQVAVLQEQNHQLASRIRRYHDPAFLAQMAQECLGMARPGEQLFTIVPKHGTPHRPVC